MNKLGDKLRETNINALQLNENHFLISNNFKYPKIAMTVENQLKCSITFH